MPPYQIKLLIQELKAHHVRHFARLLAREVFFLVAINPARPAGGPAVTLNLQLFIPDQQEGHAVFIMQRPDKLKARLPQTVRLVNNHQSLVVRQIAPDLDIELVIGEVLRTLRPFDTARGPQFLQQPGI